MPKIEWDATGEHLYETGVKHGVLYPISTSGSSAGTYPEGFAWNGLTGVTESPTGAEANPLYADDQKYLNLFSAEEFEATIEAYTYPDEFAECDGSAELLDGIHIGQQPRKTFGFSYETVVGNDVANDAYGRKIHCIYGAMAQPSEKAYSTINDSPEAITFSWSVKTVPVNVTGKKPTASLTVDTSNISEAMLARLPILEAVLYGCEEFSETTAYAKGAVVTHTESTTVKLYQANAAVEAGEWSSSDWTEISNVAAGPRLPLPDEIKTIMTPPTV